MTAALLGQGDPNVPCGVTFVPNVLICFYLPHSSPLYSHYLLWLGFFFLETSVILSDFFFFLRVGVGVIVTAAGLSAVINLARRHFIVLYIFMSNTWSTDELTVAAARCSV